MSTSGSVNFSLSRNDIITEAVIQAGILGEEEAIQNSLLSRGNLLLNSLVKTYENSALHIWKKSEATLFLQVDQSEYILGSGSTDHATESYGSTAISADEASGQTVLSIDSNSDMSNGDYIGIELNDGTLHWSTIVSSTATTVTITDALTDDADVDNVVYFYTTKIDKPLDVYSIRRRTITTSTDITLGDALSYDDFQNLPNKTTTGSVVQWHYQRKNSNGKLFVWPAPANIDYALKITYAKPLEDFDTASDTPDFPQEWYLLLIKELALLMMGPSKRGSREYTTLFNEITLLKKEVLGFDTEKTYFKMKPDNFYASSN